MVIFGLDLVFLGVMVRSYSLVDGFIDAFDMWNPIVAAPLLRMQIDNLVRLSYLARPAGRRRCPVRRRGWRVPKSQDLDGRFLTDGRLLERRSRTTRGWRPYIRRRRAGCTSLLSMSMPGLGLSPTMTTVESARCRFRSGPSAYR